MNRNEHLTFDGSPMGSPVARAFAHATHPLSNFVHNHTPSFLHRSRSEKPARSAASLDDLEWNDEDEDYNHDHKHKFDEHHDHLSNGRPHNLFPNFKHQLSKLSHQRSMPGAQPKTVDEKHPNAIKTPGSPTKQPAPGGNVKAGWVLGQADALLLKVGNAAGIGMHIPTEASLEAGETQALMEELEEEEAMTKEQHWCVRIFWRHFWWVVQIVVSVLFAAGFVLAISFINNRDSTVADAPLWKWAVLVLSISLGRAVSCLIVLPTMYCIERFFVLKSRVIYFMASLKNPIINLFWFIALLIIWVLLFDEDNLSGGYGAVLTLLAITVVASFLMIVETITLKMIATRFHLQSYYTRMAESVHCQRILMLLSQAMDKPCIFSAPGSPTEQSHVGSVLRSIPSESSLTSSVATYPSASHPPLSHSSNPHGVGSLGHPPGSHPNGVHMASAGSTSPGNLNTAERARRDSNASLTSLKSARSGRSDAASKAAAELFEHELATKCEDMTPEALDKLMEFVRKQRITTEVSLIGSNGKGTSSNEVSTGRQARALGHLIYGRLFLGKRFIKQVDVERVLGSKVGKQAWELMAQQATTDGRLYRKEFVAWCFQVYSERRSLALTMRDTNTVVQTMHRVLSCVAIVIAIIIGCIVTGVDVVNLLLGSSALLLSWVFIFGNSLRVLFETLIFLFVVHPFDVADRIEVDGIHYIVEEIGIWSCKLYETDGKLVFMPTSLLATRPIRNHRRSKDTWDCVRFTLSWASTPIEKIGQLQDRIEAFMSANQTWFGPIFRMLMASVEDNNKAVYECWFMHRNNYQDFGTVLVHRTTLLYFIKEQMQELGITYTKLSQPVEVSITDDRTGSCAAVAAAAAAAAVATMEEEGAKKAK
eukprot:jgi/Mesvir1/28999/Mv17768-RA.1